MRTVVAAIMGLGRGGATKACAPGEQSVCVKMSTVESVRRHLEPGQSATMVQPDGQTPQRTSRLVTRSRPSASHMWRRRSGHPSNV